jgi:two-component system, OmpR family, sensor kinase
VTLRWRLALVFAGATAVVLLVSGLVLLKILQTHLETVADTKLQVENATLSRLVQSRSDMLRNRPLRLAQLNSPFAPDVDELVQVFAPDGQLVLSNQVPHRRPLLDRSSLALARTHVVEFRAAVGAPGRGRLIRASAVPDRAGAGWVVLSGASLAGADALLSRLRTGVVAGGFAGIGLAGVGAWLLAGATLRPVERLRRQAEELSVKDGHAALDVPGTRDEVAQLAQTMNAMLDRLQQALLQQRRFAADAGHELRTPLTVLRAELELAKRPGRSLDELQEAVGFAVVETDRLICLAEELLLLARAEEGHQLLDLSPTPMRQLLMDEAAIAVRTRPDVDVDVDAPDETVLHVDRLRVRQAVGNLLHNALTYAPSGSRVTVGLRAERRPTGPVTVVEVADRGPGFDRSFLARAFERFERGDAARSAEGGGHGLGLAITRSIVRAHGGDAHAMNRPGGGAMVRLELPGGCGSTGDADAGEEPQRAGQPGHDDAAEQQAPGQGQRPPRQASRVDQEHLGGERAVEGAARDRVQERAGRQGRGCETEPVEAVRRHGQ